MGQLESEERKMVNCMRDPKSFSYAILHRMYSNVQHSKRTQTSLLNVSFNRLNTHSFIGHNGPPFAKVRVQTRAVINSKPIPKV